MEPATIDTKMEMFIMDSGNRITEMDKVPCSTTMAPSIKEAGKKENSKVKASSTSATGTPTMGNGSVARCTAREYWSVRVRQLR